MLTHFPTVGGSTVAPLFFVRRPGDAPVAVHHLEDQFEQKEEMSLAADDTGSRWKIIEQLLLGSWTASGADDIPGGNTIPADAWQDNFSNFGSQKQVEAEARDG